uniref:Uncharacterized protein MANES_10G044800 n=1 Tax=Rhizophora mucronata TaxID=61149 RepID=A0A2P2M0K6_RHIMU
MKGGRKNLKKAARDRSFTLEDGQSIMQVLSLRGSNLIEVPTLFMNSGLLPFHMSTFFSHKEFLGRMNFFLPEQWSVFVLIYLCLSIH